MPPGFWQLPYIIEVSEPRISRQISRRHKNEATGFPLGISWYLGISGWNPPQTSLARGRTQLHLVFLAKAKIRSVFGFDMLAAPTPGLETWFLVLFRGFPLRPPANPSPARPPSFSAHSCGAARPSWPGEARVSVNGIFPWHLGSWQKGGNPRMGCTGTWNPVSFGTFSSAHAVQRWVS